MLNRRNQIKMKFFKMFKYGLVGVLGAFIHFGVLVLLVEKFQVVPVLSSSIGFVIVVVISYVLNKYWTFQTKNKSFSEFTKYMIVSCSGLVMNIVIMYFSVDVFHLDYIIGQLIVTFIIPLSNYTLNHLWTFKHQGS